MTRAPDGSVLDVGRRTRTIPLPLRRALEYRDRHCCFPGCTVRFCEGHHIEHWANGGETNLQNITLLCKHHHRSVHEGDILVERNDDGDLVFRHRSGWILRDAPRPWTLSERELEVLEEELTDPDVEVDPWGTAIGEVLHPVDYTGALTHMLRSAALDRVD